MRELGTDNDDATESAMEEVGRGERENEQHKGRQGGGRKD